MSALTGCDTVSALTGRGKPGALKLIKKDNIYQETFNQLGQSREISKQLFNKIQLFTCHVYATTASTDEVNELCYQLVYAKRGEVECSQLPPCRYCLHMHVLRANYQASIWKWCNQTQPFVADLKEEGRQMMTAIWSSSGCALLQPQMQFWNCCRASACLPANCQAGRALSTDVQQAEERRTIRS